MFEVQNSLLKRELVQTNRAWNYSRAALLTRVEDVWKRKLADPQLSARDSNFNSKMKFDTDYPADSVEFCPSAGFEDVFVCGTYKLLQNSRRESEDVANDASSRQRIGKCIVFKVSRGQDGDIL